MNRSYRLAAIPAAAGEHQKVVVPAKAGTHTTEDSGTER